MERVLEGKAKRLIDWVCIFFALFHVYTAGFGALPDIQHPAVYVLLGLIGIFSLWGATKEEAKKHWLPLYDIILILVAAVACLNIIIRHTEIMINPIMYTKWDVAFGACLLVLVLEATRRTIGWVLPVIALSMIVYSWRTGTTLEFIIAFQYHHDQGMWGTLTEIGATIIAIFLVFGSFLLFSGGGQTFIDIANKVAGKYRGGPAKIAVIGSCLFGMLSGSAVANVATTGTFTIPLMKKIGYRPETAGAIEAVASTGGQIMPPIMGAAAFIMAELLGVSYGKIILYAILPALLYYGAVYFFVHFEAVKRGIQTYESELAFRDVLTWTRIAPLALPIIGFLIFLALGFTATFCCFLASMLCVFLFIFKDLSFSGIKHRILQLREILPASGKSIAYVVPLLTCAQIVVGMLGETGLGTKLASLVVALGASHRILGLIAAAVLALILGMGVPPSAAYILTAAIAAPALLRLGVGEIPAHFFVLNMANFGAITPPVCAAVFVGAAIAKAPWLKTGFEAVKIGSTAMILPFTYTIFEPYLLGWGPAWIVALNFALAFLGALFMASAMSGAFFKGSINFLFRPFFGIGGFLLVIPFGWQIRIVGIALILFALVAIRLAEAKELNRVRAIPGASIDDTS